MKLYYLVEINQINDKMVELVSTEYPFEDMASKIASMDSLVTLRVPFNQDATEEECEDYIERIKTNSFAVVRI